MKKNILLLVAIILVAGIFTTACGTVKKEKKEKGKANYDIAKTPSVEAPVE